MACQKVCEQGRDDIIVKVNLQSPEKVNLQSPESLARGSDYQTVALA